MSTWCVSYGLPDMIMMIGSIGNMCNWSELYVKKNVVIYVDASIHVDDYDDKCQ